MRASEGGLLGNLEQARDSWIKLLMQRMAESGNGAPLFARRDQRVTDGGIRGTGAAACVDIRKKEGCRFRGAQYYGPAAEYPGSNRALHRLRGGGECHAGGSNAWHEAVLGDRDQGRIEQAALRRGWEFARHEQPGVVGEGHIADQVLAQIMPANHDCIGVRRRNSGTSPCLRTDLH